MTDHDTGELPPTEPARPEDRTPASTQPPSANRRSGPTQELPARRVGGIPGTWVVAALLVLLVAFGAGFLAGRAGEPVPDEGRPAAGRPPKAGGGGGGKARRGAPACRLAIALAGQLIALQERSLATQTAVIEGVIAGDTERVAALRAQSEQLAQQTQGLRRQYNKAARRCVR